MLLLETSFSLASWSRAPASSASPGTPLPSGSFSLHNEAAHHFSPSHLLSLSSTFPQLWGQPIYIHGFKVCASQFFISPDLSSRLTQNPIRSILRMVPRYSLWNVFQDGDAHLLRLPRLLLLTFTSRPLLCLCSSSLGMDFPEVTLNHSFSFIFSITKSCWFCLLHLSQLRPYMHPHRDHQGSGHTRGFFVCLFTFCFCLVYPIINFQCFNHLIALL